MIKFHFLSPFSLKNRRWLKAFLQRLVKAEGKQLISLDYIFCSDEFLLDINKRFLNHDDLTDIITFDLSDTTDIRGEVYISIERIRENALSYGVKPTDELHRVMFHGALHLCGFKDKTQVDQIEMRRKEDQYLAMR